MIIISCVVGISFSEKRNGHIERSISFRFVCNRIGPGKNMLESLGRCNFVKPCVCFFCFVLFCFFCLLMHLNDYNKLCVVGILFLKKKKKIGM